MQHSTDWVFDPRRLLADTVRELVWLWQSGMHDPALLAGRLRPTFWDC